MKNAVFWDIKSQFVSLRRHITYPLQSPAWYCYVRFEAFTAVTMKNAVFWNVTPCGSIVKTDILEERTASIFRVTKIVELGTTLLCEYFRSVRRFVVTANVVPISQIWVTLIMKALRSSVTSVLIRVTRSNIPEDSILHSLRSQRIPLFKVIRFFEIWFSREVTAWPWTGICDVTAFRKLRYQRVISRSFRNNW
jgi:hypothetical protein